jgi:hypothetical protein
MESAGERLEKEEEVEEHWTVLRKNGLISSITPLYESLGKNLKKLYFGLEKKQPESDIVDNYLDLILQDIEESCRLFLDYNAKGREEPVHWTQERRNHLIVLVDHLYTSVSINLEKLHWYLDWDNTKSDALDHYLDLLDENVEENCKMFLDSMTIDDNHVRSLLNKYCFQFSD